MKWMGKTLEFKEDWAAAMIGLNTDADAAAFQSAAEEFFGGGVNACQALGYLTAEIDPRHGERARIRELLGVKHPFGDGKNAGELLAVGIALAQAPNLPDWLKTVTEIPRRSWNARFED